MRETRLLFEKEEGNEEEVESLSDSCLLASRDTQQKGSQPAPREGPRCKEMEARFVPDHGATQRCQVTRKMNGI